MPFRVIITFLTQQEQHMNEMTTEQRAYFIRRMDEITAEKLQAKAVELFGASGRPQQPTWGMVFEGIRSGEIVLKEDKVDYTGPYLNPSDVVWPAMEAKTAELAAYKEQLATERKRAMDAVMLGNEAQAQLAAYAKA
jgi:hypothetical protein